jgi:hypothetical protein
MRQKYISTQIQLVCRSEQPETKDIHAQLQQTIAERKAILPDWESLFLNDNTTAATIHFQHKNSIAKLKREKLRFSDFFTSKPGDIYTLTAKKAA